MINLEKDTPVEYSKQSRDYQVFVFLYNAIFNQAKMYVDLIKNIWTDNIDTKLLDLRSYTLNFIPKFEWENQDLLGVTNCFRYLVRTKGTEDAIKKSLEILSRIKGIDLIPGSDSRIIVENGVVKLLVSEEIDDIGNIEDLLRYILPAGMPYEIVKYSRVSTRFKNDIVVDSKFEKSGELKSEKIFLSTKESSEGIYPVPGIVQSVTGSIINYDVNKIVTDGSEGDTPYGG